VSLEDSAEDLYENAPCGYISTRADGVVVRVNGTFLKWTGHVREELVGKKRLSDLFTVGGRIFFETHLAPLLAMQGFVNEVAVDIACPGRDALPALMNVVQSKDGDGNVSGLRATILDATDRRKFERELIAARKAAESATQAKSGFVSMISHEIRTPLNAITGVAHLLATTALSPQQEKYLRILKSSSENLLALINDILDFSKIEAGKVTLEKRVFDLRARLYEIASEVGVRADEKKLALSIDVDERVPPLVIGDPLKFGQIVTNLVGNAIKFTAKGGVTVGCRVAAEDADSIELELRVTDTGIGIAPDRLASIFEDFSQESYDISVRYGGTGLGLAIVRRLVDMHGGRVRVESTPGTGSTFSFTMRVEVPPASLELVAATEDEETELEGLRVLVADDNEVNVFVMAGMLRRWGVQYDVVANGAAAVEMAASSDYDVVLMDLRMPEMDGYEATRRIRAIGGRRGAVPVIAVSASTRIGAAPAIAEAGFTDFVGKPIAGELLAEAIRRCTGRRA
jgi:PAS domain S-box-containing protein